MFLYAAAIFLSAFLLFLIQPLIARIILPWFGGSAAVWTTCLMFFQTVLLGGYFYAHQLTRRLTPRRQAGVHVGLLAASLALLPVLPGAGWKPADSLHPELRILVLLAAVVGIPYLLLSATGPLLQAWYTRADAEASPYRLYALSNAGSLLALLGYPALIEPSLRIAHQAYFWSAGYAAFAGLCGLTAWRGLRPAQEEHPASLAPAVRPAGRQLTRWAALAFCPSALLVAVSSHMTQNIAPIPLLWVLPLALYLLSFILTFESARWYRRGIWFPAFVTLTAIMIALLFPEDRNVAIKIVIPFFLSGFFCCAMVCHGELYRLRPPADALTYFYLMISLGSALGGLFVGVAAPLVFNNYYELPVALLATTLFVSLAFRRGETALPGPTARMVQWAVFAALAAGLIYLTAYELPQWGSRFKRMERSFYGVLRVQDFPETETTAGLRSLEHGTINHGSEFMEPSRHREPTTYYGRQSGAGMALSDAAGPAARRVGVIGLGAGTLAAYARAGDVYRFYEINPQVVRIARDEFFFLKECPAQLAVVLGDARLSLERETAQHYDVLAVDAFSGDSIPVHLVTVEAMREYLRHLGPDGLLLMHVSNKYLDLRKVVARAAAVLHLAALAINNPDDANADVSRSEWIVLARSASRLERSEWQVATRLALPDSGMRPWTDDYSSVLDILK